MRKIQAFCLLSMLFSSLYGQKTNPFFELKSDSSVKWGMGLFADYNLGSNAITNGFLNNFYTGGFIDSTQKLRVKNKLSTGNRLGGDANEGIFYLHKLDSFRHRKTFAWFISVKNRAHVNLAFSRDLYNVAFFGNDGYRGQTADFSGFNLYLIRYQQFQAGLISDRFGVGLSVYNGQQLQLLQAKTATMYTSTFGEYIDFKTSYTMINSNPGNTAFGTSNGIGAGLDFYGRMPLELSNGQKGDLFVELADFGFIHWDAKTNHYKNDTTYHFDGFAVKNAFQLADSSVHYSAKNIVHVNPNQQTPFASQLPATLDVKFVPNGIRYQFVFGVNYRFVSDYKPYGYAQCRYHFKNHYSINLEMGYGGYSNFQTGFSLQARYKKGLSVHLGTMNLLGYIAPEYTCGQGAYVSISKVFR